MTGEPWQRCEPALTFIAANWAAILLGWVLLGCITAAVASAFFRASSHATHDHPGGGSDRRWGDLNSHHGAW